MKNYYKSGLWNVICDRCGKKIKADEAKTDWQGFVVCPDDYEQRHEQDFVKARQDKITIPFSRPVPTYVYTDVVYACTVDGKTAKTNWAVAGCSITGTN